MLPPDRLNRFARHIVLPELGGAGQIALTRAHVVLIGCGGIGSPALQYLAAAGIGHLTLIDDDTVEPDNLQRQTIFAAADIGRAKTEAAADWVRRFDPALTVLPVCARLTAANARALLSGAPAGPAPRAGAPARSARADPPPARSDAPRPGPTVILDGCDNFATRLAVSDAAVALHIPLTSAAVGRFQGQVANFAGHLPGQACYRCFVGDAFDADDCDTCAADGVLGAFVGLTGALAAMAAIRAILAAAQIAGPLADAQWGHLALIDGLAPSLRTLTLPRDPACPAHG